ncbi:HdaA/DnaA family protein [Paracoccaceae bacterium GXU_MW_L88]
MSEPARQLRLPLPRRQALGREDFIISQPNALALAMVEDWRNWPEGKLVLSGPAGSGKTHLAHVWATQTGALIVDAESLASANLPGLARRPVAVEDLDRLNGPKKDAAEAALFHLHNLLAEAGQALMITGRGVPAHWAITLPDLASRVRAANLAQINPPDDALLGALLYKLFDDRGLVPPGEVVTYMVARMERSFETARRLVAQLDEVAMESRREITVPLAASVMQALGAQNDDRVCETP